MTDKIPPMEYPRSTYYEPEYYEWGLCDDGVFHTQLPKWIIRGPREWTSAYTLDNSPPPKELQKEKGIL